MTPKDLKLSISCDLAGLVRVASLTSTKVGCPNFALASTMNFPMYPVPPTLRILVAIFFPIKLNIYFKYSVCTLKVEETTIECCYEMVRAIYYL